MYGDEKYQRSYGLIGLSSDGKHNDVGPSDSAFELVNSRTYSFVITPLSPYWRFGVRVAQSPQADYENRSDRYADVGVKHIEVCVGEQLPDNSWGLDTNLYLQEYHIQEPIKGRVNNLKTWPNYKPLSDVHFSVTRELQNLIVSCRTIECEIHTTQLKIGEGEAYFKFFAWADELDFKLDCTLQRSAFIRLNNIKALSQQTEVLEIGNLMIFFGPNNSGKSSIILGAAHHFMNTGDFVMDYIGPDRFTTSDNIASASNVQEKLERRKQRNTYGDQCENRGPDGMLELSSQDRETRKKILDWFNLNIEEFTISRKDVDEYFAAPEAKFGNHTPKQQGTGLRSLLSIVTQLFDRDVKFLSIDEPELSLEPTTQKKLFDLIKKAVNGEDGVPQKTVLLATHSHIFLDKDNPFNNFKVTKVNGKVMIDQVRTEDQLQEAVYKLLGNNPADLFFPANIVVVEGRSDKIFLDAVLEVLIRNGILERKKIVFHFVEGLGKAKLGLLAVDEMLKTQSYVPVYRDKICGLFDRPNNNNERDLIRGIVTYFEDNGSRFATLNKNAIEYYYPIQLVNELTGKKLSLEEFENGTNRFLEQVKANNKDHTGTYFDVTIDKVSLAEGVANMLTKSNDHNLIDGHIVSLLKHAIKLAY